MAKKKNSIHQEYLAETVLTGHERYINPYTDFGFKKLFEQAEIARFTPQDVRDYEESIKIYRDLTNVVNTAERKGREKEKYATALKMKGKGYSVTEILDITGLTAEEIENL